MPFANCVPFKRFGIFGDVVNRVSTDPLGRFECKGCDVGGDDLDSTSSPSHHDRELPYGAATRDENAFAH